MIQVSHGERVVFPAVGKTKAEVVAYYDRMAARILPYVVDRPLSILRYPKGLAARGFFQKNVPAHYPASMGRVSIPRSEAASKRHRDPDARERDVTTYPIVRELEHIPYLANQNAIELHVPTARAGALFTPDRVVIDLDPPPGALSLVRAAAHLTREALARFGLDAKLLATGSKGYHLIAAIEPTVASDVLARALHQFAVLLTKEHEDTFTLVFRVAKRGERVFVDWLRNHPLATVVAPYSLRAKPRATVATPIAWSEIDSVPPDGFTIDDIERLLDRPDSLAELEPARGQKFVSAVAAAFDASGLELETVDRFRR